MMGVKGIGFGIISALALSAALVLSAIDAGAQNTPRGQVLGAISDGDVSAASVAAARVGRGQQTGLRLPRYVSLRRDKVNIRTGPGLSYPIDWVYQRVGLPIEVTAEFETWRRVRDHEGTEGWVHHSMLSGQRSALIHGQDADQTRLLLAAPDTQAPAVARVEPGVIGAIRLCDGAWCQLDVEGHVGWLPISALYGVRDGEQVQ
ncbi:MAG: SH3 domain-containing protein [Pseudomonadota bacterium]